VIKQTEPKYVVKYGANLICGGLYSVGGRLQQ